MVVITATRGELGEVPGDLSEDGESLADRRTDELTRACEVLGVSRLEFLGYRDSGMADESTNQQPECFAAADVDEAAARLAATLDDERADVLVAYDEHGGYGHPDHVQVHRVGMRGAELAGTARVYMATQDRDYIQSLMRQAGVDGWSLPEDVAESTKTMGEPGSRITTEVDVTPWIGAKRRAMQAHPSQIGETSFFLSMPEDVFETVWGREWYIRVRPEAADPHVGPRETGLLG